MSRDELSPTVYGIETEYSMMIRFPNSEIHEMVGECHSIDAELGLYQEPDQGSTDEMNIDSFQNAIVSNGLVTNASGMLSNGGRLYIEPSGPEYATPESRTAEEAVHRSFDGDKILLGALHYLMDEGMITGYQVNRRVVDHNRTSRGIHLNTCTSLTEDDNIEEVYERLATLNATKGAMFGSGGLLLNKHGETEFHHSPRLSITSHAVHEYQSFMYRKRPLVRMPFKPDVDPYFRVETVSSDALSFAWPLRASMVITNSLIKLIELRHHRALPLLSKPVEAALRIGKNGNEHLVAVMGKGHDTQEVYPSEILRYYAEESLDVHEAEGHLDDESVQVLNEVIDCADNLERDPYMVAMQVESLAREHAFQRKMEKDGVDLNSETMCRYDYYWDKLEGGLAEKMRLKKAAGWLGFSSTKSVKPSRKELITPPEDTRAYLRGELIKSSPVENSTTWDSFEDAANVSFKVHPYASELPDDFVTF